MARKYLCSAGTKHTFSLGGLPSIGLFKLACQAKTGSGERDGAATAAKRGGRSYKLGNDQEWSSPMNLLFGQESYMPECSVNTMITFFHSPVKVKRK